MTFREEAWRRVLCKQISRQERNTWKKYEDLERNLLSCTISNSNTSVARYIDVIYLKERFLEVRQISPKTSNVLYLYFPHVTHWNSSSPHPKYHPEQEGVDRPVIKVKILSASSASYSLCICSYKVRKHNLNLSRLCEILGFGRGVFKAFFLLGCWSAFVGNLLRTSRDSVSVPSPRKEEFFWDILRLEDLKDPLPQNSEINHSGCYQSKNCVELSVQDICTLHCGA